MKLSEAIRLGAMLRPQARGNLFSQKGSCALGAAAEAAGVYSYNANLGDYDALKAHFSLLRQEVTHVVDFDKRPLVEHIYDLNDSHHWSREAIADWVETIEREQECVTESAPVREEVSVGY